MKINTQLRDLIFRILFKRQEEKSSFYIKAGAIWVFVDCGRIDGAIGIKDDKSEWAGNRVPAANRLALMNVDIGSIREGKNGTENFA